MLSLLALFFGFCLDLLLGDPHWLPHPVRLMGRWIALLERGLRRILPKTPGGERVGGVLLVLFVVLPAVGIPFGILVCCQWVSPWLRLMVESVFCYELLAVRALKDESGKVCDALLGGNLPGARKAVSMIVGRDTQGLDEEGVAKAAVETVAENTCDGAVAPLFYLALFGAVGGFVYKAVNTMDSMVGYHNERYRFFGTAAARVDDVLSFLPSRLAALLMILYAPLAGLDGKGAWRVFVRDRFCHKSPNSAQTEAACAGALGVCLAGDAVYFGVLHKKPTIGDALRPVVPQDIQRAHRLLYGASLLALLLFGGVRAILLMLL